MAKIIKIITAVIIVLLTSDFINYNIVNSQANKSTINEKVDLVEWYTNSTLALVNNVKYYNKNIDDRSNIIDSKGERPKIKNLNLNDDLCDYIWIKSNEYDFSYEFVLAIIGVESNYGQAKKNKNKNGTVDAGLAQINSKNVKWLAEMAGIEDVDVYNDYHNVDMMFELLKYERDYFRKLGYSEEEVFLLTCLAYNMGRSGAIKYVKKNGFVENDYVKKVLSEKEKLESEIY
jgi:hypothetical protein